MDSLALVGHRYPAGGPVQQTSGERGLQRGDPLADERWRRAKLGRRGREAAVPQHDAEQLQIGQGRKIMHDSSRSRFPD